MKEFDFICALKALGEENRLRMLRLLMKRERSVKEIAEALGMTHYNVSKHLEVLRAAGLVNVRARGQQRIYDLAEDFRGHLSKNANVLDLGGCTFYFNKLPG